MTTEEILDLSTAVLSAGVKLAGLAEQAFAAARAGDDAKALEHLDEAVTHLGDATPVVRAQLEALKVTVKARMDAKFPAGT